MSQDKKSKEIAKKEDVLAMAKEGLENDLIAMQKFNSVMNKPPKAVWVKTDSNGKYMSISRLEMLLDEFYFGQWSTSNVTTQVFANEILVSLELEVINPVTGRTLKRLGAASVPIQQNAGAKVTDVEQKKKNALVKNFPAAKAMAFKNACKTLGKLFGRDLNRDDKLEAQFEGVIKDEAKKAKEAQE